MRVCVCAHVCVCVCVHAYVHRCACAHMRVCMYYYQRDLSMFAQLEESEDHLRDSLAHTNAERDELLQRVDSLQSTVTTHEEEIE